MFSSIFLVLTCFLAAAVNAVPTGLDAGRNRIAPFAKRDIGSTLGPQLSPGAAIYTKSDSLFHNESLRWTAYSAPTFQAVVEVATEEDIVASVSSFSMHNRHHIDSFRSTMPYPTT
jgi:hypothetical protein